MKLLDRIATPKKSAEPERPPLCNCEKPAPRWRKIDGQIFCLVCTPPPDGAAFLVDAILHLPADGFSKTGSSLSASADDLQPYEPLAKAVPWSHPSIVRSVYEGYGLLPPESDSPSPAPQEGDSVAWDAELASWALSLRQPSGTRVVHLKRDQFDVNIGRPSKWGNPFSHKDGTLAKYRVDSRAEALLRYREWITEQPALMGSLDELRGKTLGCWCKPLPCHGDVLVSLIDGPQLPPDPWQFAPHSRITCNRRWLAYLQADVRRGPCGPRAKTGALQKQLRQLRTLID